MKKCSKCRQAKQYSGFHKNCAQPDGFANQCIECFNKTHKRYRNSVKGQISIKKYRASDRCKTIMCQSAAKYERSEKGKATKKRFKQTKIGKELSRRATRKYAAKNRQKLRAHWAIKQKVKHGRMSPATDLSCNACEKPASHYHHYNGYSRKCYYDVIPLCTQCHKDTHK